MSDAHAAAPATGTRKNPIVLDVEDADMHEVEHQASLAFSDIRPRAAHRPPVNAAGAIDMGAQQCLAYVEDSEAAQRCVCMTLAGAYCASHQADLYGTAVRHSAIGGRGLFALRAFARGDVVAHYTGDLLMLAPQPASGSVACEQQLVQLFEGSHYVLQLSRTMAVDAARTNTQYGRFVNDARGTGQRNNVRFSASYRSQQWRVTLKAMRAIRPQEEILVSYGRCFWPA